MSTKKVDLVVYVDGVRKVIGEAVVDLAPNGTDFLDVSGVVTDPNYKLLLNDHSKYSLNVEAFCQPKAAPVASSEGVRINGRAPRPEGNLQ